MNKKLLVTGASGFVGFHLLEKAAAAGFEIHAAVRKSSNIEEITPFVSKFVYPNFEDSTSLLHLFQEEKYDYVIHAAAMTKAKSAQAMFHVNVKYTELLLEAAFQADVPPKRFVFVSSLAALGPIGYADGFLKDDSPYHPVTVYGRSKQAAEQMIKQRFADKPISIVRPTAVYGPREKDLFILFDTMNKGLDVYIGKNPQKLSFIYVQDLVNGLLKACVNPQTGLTAFNITDGNVYSRYAMAEIFKRTLNKKPLRVHVCYSFVKQIAKISEWLYKSSPKTPVLYPERLNELTAENWSCDISAAKQSLGFSPQYDLDSGLKESLLWYKRNNWL